MMNRRGYRRALSTVVTSAILLSAVAIMGTMVVTWANMKLSSQEEALTVTFNKKCGSYAPVLCSVTIMYATSSTKDSSLLTRVYCVALFQKVSPLYDFSLKVCSLNVLDCYLI